LREAGSTNEEVRLNAVRTLAWIHAEPSVVVPALVASLSDTNVFVREVAAEGLGGFGTDARQAVPALLRLLSDPAEYVAPSNALKKIDPDAAAKAGVK
jgi:HEAT repeat protein